MNSTFFIVATILAISAGTLHSSNVPLDSYNRLLNSKLSKHRDDVAYMKTYGREKLEGHYKESKDSILDHAFELIHRAKTVNSCSESFNEALDRIPYNVFFSWDACVRLPKILKEYGVLINEMELDYSGSETVVCDGIQSAALCDGNWMDKANCIASVAQKTFNEYQGSSKGVAYYLSAFSSLLSDTITTTKKCFSLSSLKAKDLIQTAINKHC